MPATEVQPDIFDASRYAHPDIIKGTILEHTLQGMQKAYANTMLSLEEKRDGLKRISSMFRGDDPETFDALQTLPDDVKAFRDQELLPMLGRALEDGMRLGTELAFVDLQNADQQEARNILARYCDGSYGPVIDSLITTKTDSMRDSFLYSQNLNADEMGILADEIEKSMRTNVLDEILNVNDAQRIQSQYDELQEKLDTYDLLRRRNFLEARQVGLTLLVFRGITDAVLQGGFNPEFAARVNPQKTGERASI